MSTDESTHGLSKSSKETMLIQKLTTSEKMYTFLTRKTAITSKQDLQKDFYGL